MNVFKLFIVVLILCPLAPLTSGQTRMYDRLPACRVASGQTLTEKLALKVDAFNSESKSIPMQLIEVAQRFSIPMGIEWADDSQDRPASPIQVQDTTVRHLLDQILSGQSGYQFQLDDDVVHVFAVRLVDDPRNFLNIRLRQFSLEKANMAAARFYLWGAIISNLHPRGGYAGGWGGQSIYKDFDAAKITFSYRDLTVRQALNRIVEAEGNALWVVRIRPRQMMATEPYYVQIPGPEGGEPAESFAWQFLALDVHRLQ
jgi:hypothetical protein